MTRKNFDDDLVWRKSTRSTAEGSCLYAAATPSAIGIRDSKQGSNGPRLWLPTPEWTALLATLKDNQLSS